MRAGVVGRIGAHAVATVRKGEKQFQRSRDQELVFQKHTEERVALFLRKKPDRKTSLNTKKNKLVPSFQIVPFLQHWDPGESGHLAHRPAIKKMGQFPRPRGQDPVRKHLSLRIRVWTMASSLAKTSKRSTRSPRIVTSTFVQVNQTSQPIMQISNADECDCEGNTSSFYYSCYSW